MRFIKMQGAGNDFVLIDSLDQAQGGERPVDWSELARRMSDRRFGVGSDGLLVVQPSGQADFRMAMWNPDGSESEMCGNGIRCFARYLLDGPAQGRRRLTVETGAGVLEIVPDGSSGWLRVNMGIPILNGPDIPVESADNPVLDLLLPEFGFKVTCVSMGNPHAIRLVDDPWAIDLAELGPRVERHRFFPRRTNFHLCQRVSSTELTMRTWERGAGPTLACGTGACATAVAARLHGLTEETVNMHVPGGELRVSWNGSGPVYLSGPAELVYIGEWPAQATSAEEAERS